MSVEMLQDPVVIMEEVDSKSGIIRPAYFWSSEENGFPSNGRAIFRTSDYAREFVEKYGDPEKTYVMVFARDLPSDTK